MSLNEPDAQHRPRTASSRATVSHAWVGSALVVVSTCFNLVLCFVNTKHWLEIGNLQISIVQVAILAVGFVAIREQIGPNLLAGALSVAILVFALKLINPGLDPKILFDLALVPVFILPGRSATVRQTDHVVSLLLTIVIVVGLFELLAPGLFERIFDIRSYYLAKGALDIDDINYGGTNFFVSGSRSDAAGRNMLAWLLGPHRVSSVFLEPVSMGNFPVVCLIWLLGRARLADWRTIGVLTAIMFCIVLPDSRFAGVCFIFIVLMRFARWQCSPILVVMLPLSTCVALYLFGATQETALHVKIGIVSDDLIGRLRFSGTLLASWSIGEWLAILPSAVYTADTGYAYIINQIGLPATVTLWITLAYWTSPEVKDRKGQCFAAIYVATSLCVGASLFSIKTAALLWFIVGATQAKRI